MRNLSIWIITPPQQTNVKDRDPTDFAIKNMSPNEIICKNLHIINSAPCSFTTEVKLEKQHTSLALNFGG